MNLEKSLQILEQKNNKQLAAFERSLKTDYAKMQKKVDKRLNTLIKKEQNASGKGLSYKDSVKKKELQQLSDAITKALDDLKNKTGNKLVKGLENNYLLNHAYYAYALEMATESVIEYAIPKKRIVQAAVNNPIDKLTLNHVLEKNRREITFKIKAELTRSAKTGARYNDIAKRIQDMLMGDYRKAILIARTEMHRVKERAKSDAANEQQKKGVLQTKRWKTMHDSRVRSLHQDMDGVVLDVDEKFLLPDGYEGDAPGSVGAAKHDCNCRCLALYRVVDVRNTSGVKPITTSKDPNKWAQDKDAQLKRRGQKKANLQRFESELDRLNYRSKKKYLAEIDKALADAPQFIRDVWNERADLIKFMKIKNLAGTPHYDRSTKGIYFSIESDRRNMITAKNETVFHELGHLFDMKPKEKMTLMGEDSSFAYQYKNNLFSKTLRDEANLFVKKMTVTRDAKTEAAKKRVIQDYFSGISDRAQTDVSDILEGATLGKYHGYYGHGTRYWNTHDVATEAFAEMFSATIVNPDSLAMIKQIFPKSYDIFVEICKEQIKYDKW